MFHIHLNLPICVLLLGDTVITAILSPAVCDLNALLIQGT